MEPCDGQATLSNQREDGLMETAFAVNPPKRAEVRLGFVTLAQPHQDLEQALRAQQGMAQRVRDLGATPVVCNRFVMDRDSLASVMAQLKNGQVNALLILFGSYGPDDFALELSREFAVPLIMWAPPEPLSPELFPPNGSLVGLTQTAGTMERLGRRVYPFFGTADHPAVQEGIGHTLRLIGVAETLRHARVGMVGPGCPGMLDTHFDDLLLRSQLGLEIVQIPMVGFLDAYAAVSEEEAHSLAEPIRSAYPVREPTDEHFTSSAKVYLALRRLVLEHDLSALSVRCWPELKAHGIVSPCLALSLLADQGVQAACEGDGSAAVSMLILYLLTGKPVYFGDFLNVDERTDEVLMFHCGSGAFGLSASGKGLSLRTNSWPAVWKPGVTVEFPVQPGPVTFLRFGQKGHGFRALIARGLALEHAPFCRGTTIRVRPDVGGRAMLDGLIHMGTEHHQLVGLGDVKDDAIALCELWGIQADVIE
ncbi:MAG: L-fucose/L-arabinose isomerase family protein [Anaerolineae bacterium]